MPGPTDDHRDMPPLDDRVVAAFAALVDVPTDERAHALESVCGSDLELRAAVEALLRDHDAPPPILGRMLDEAARRRDPTQAPGTMVGPFRIQERIGQGGMGIVYRALQDRPRRDVALKVLSAGRGQPEQVARFEREIEVLGRLQHPGICRIFDAGTADLGPGLDRTQWFAMEFLDGTPIVEFAARHALDTDARCLLMAEVADAMQHAHERGVVHRDLKPSNVLVVRGDDGRPAPKVLDFGIAHAVDADAAASMRTRTGMLLGTIDYMSPEQLDGGPQRVDARSDVYSMGVLLYELLAGRLPHDLADRSLTEVCRIVADCAPPPLFRRDRGAFGDLETIVQKAMAKDGADRFATAAEFAADLRRFVRREPVLARRPTALYRLRKFSQRNRRTVAVVGATMACLALGLVWVAVLAARNDSLAFAEQSARTAAEAAGKQLRASLYRSQMRLGTEAMFAAGGVARTRQIANEWLPAPGEDDARAFEWRLLWASCHDEAAVWPSLPAPAQIRWLADGRWFVAHQFVARFVESTSGRVVTEFAPGLEPAAPSAVSADGSVFAQAVAGNSVTLRAVGTDSSATGLAWPAGGLELPAAAESIALSGDGAFCAVFVPPHGILVHGRDGTLLARIPSSSPAMGFRDDGKRFAAIQHLAGQNHVVVFDTASWQQPARELPCGNDNVAALCLSPAGDLVAFTSFEGGLGVFDVASGAQRLDVRHGDSLRGVAFSPDGARVAVGCRDYVVYLHDLSNGTVRTLRGHEGIVSAVAFEPNGNRLVSAGDDLSLRVWDLAATPVRRERHWQVAHVIEHAQLAWSRDGRSVALRAAPLIAAQWNVDADAIGDGFVVDANGKSFATDRDGSSIRLDGEPWQQSPRPLRFLVPSRQGDVVVGAVGRDGPLLRWRRGDATPFAKDSVADVRGLDWLADGRLVLVDASDTIRVLANGDLRELVAQPVAQCTLAVAVPREGDAIAVGCVDQTIRLWSPSRGFGAVLRGHTGHVQALAYSPDGTRLASGSRERSLRIWDVEAAAEVASLPISGQPVAIAWSPDNTRLAVLQHDGTAVVFDARRGTGH